MGSRNSDRVAWTWALAEDDARLGLGLRSGDTVAGGADPCRAASDDVVVVVVVALADFDMISGVLAPAPPGVMRLEVGRLTAVDADPPSPSWGGEEDAVVGDSSFSISYTCVCVRCAKYGAVRHVQFKKGTEGLQ